MNNKVKRKEVNLDGPSAVIALLGLCVGIAVFMALTVYTFIPEPIDSLICTIPVLLPILGLIFMVLYSVSCPEDVLVNRVVNLIVMLMTASSVFLLLLSPGSVSYAKGDISRYQDKPDEAERYYLNAIELGKGSRTVVDVKTILIDLYVQEERYSAAEELLLANFKEDPREWKDDIKEKLPDILRKQGKHEEADKWEKRM